MEILRPSSSPTINVVYIDIRGMECTVFHAYAMHFYVTLNGIRMQTVYYVKRSIKENGMNRKNTKETGEVFLKFKHTGESRICSKLIASPCFKQYPRMSGRHFRPDDTKLESPPYVWKNLLDSKYTK